VETSSGGVKKRYRCHRFHRFHRFQRFQRFQRFHRFHRRLSVPLESHVMFGRSGRVWRILHVAHNSTEAPNNCCDVISHVQGALNCQGGGTKSSLKIGLRPRGRVIRRPHPLMKVPKQVVHLGEAMLSQGLQHVVGVEGRVM
jgi:hypothetical protein